ncbi:MAG: tripartite tricarboxylate transporter substrate binding protein [Variovorax sp.]
MQRNLSQAMAVWGTSLAAVFSIMSAPALAQAPAYPQQTIKLIVPFTPGTGMDTIARAVSPKLSERLGQPVIVQNAPGASGNIGTDMVAKAKPDGYTVLVGANTMLIASQLYKTTPFDPLKDFSSVALAARGTLMLVANPKSGIKTLPDLIAAAKANPGAINYGSPGVGTPHHMAMELLKTQEDISLLHVPYKGSAGYTTDLLGGQISVGFLPVHVAQSFVAAGKLNALAVGSAKRNPVAPDVPTISEAGGKPMDVDMWYAFLTPANTPEPIVKRLNTEIDAIMNLPEIREVLGKAGLVSDPSSPQELTKLMASDYPRWGNVIRKNNITAE